MNNGLQKQTGIFLSFLLFGLALQAPRLSL